MPICVGTHFFSHPTIDCVTHMSMAGLMIWKVTRKWSLNQPEGLSEFKLLSRACSQFPSLQKKQNNFMIVASYNRSFWYAQPSPVSWLQHRSGSQDDSSLLPHFLLVSYPDTTHLTQGEGVWCHKSKSLA